MMDSEIRSAQTLIMIALFAAPISLLVGGVLLSAIALICAVLARQKLKRVMLTLQNNSSVLNTFKQSTIALGISCTALAFNMVALVLIMPMLLDTIQSGNLQELIGQAESVLSASSASSASSSVWG